MTYEFYKNRYVYPFNNNIAIMSVEGTARGNNYGKYYEGLVHT